MDPAEASLASPSDLMVLDLLHDGLTRLDADGVAAAGAGRGAGRATPRSTAFRFDLAPEATFTERPRRHRRRT